MLFNDKSVLITVILSDKPNLEAEWDLLSSCVRHDAGLCKGNENLGDKKFGDFLREPTLFTGQDHFQNVPSQFLHYNEYSLQCLKHTLEVDNTRIVKVLQNM